MAGEVVLALVRLKVPVSNVVLSDKEIAQKAKELVGAGVDIGAEQVEKLWVKLQDILGNKLDNYLEPSLKLGLGLGQDLAQFAKEHPLLIFFDTYEEVDEADNLLRQVMGAAGVRVGWVIAGRDNLWAGLSQRLRSIGTEYGYKDITLRDRRMVVDFSADGVGDFTLSDIEEYFALLCAMNRQSPLPPVSEKEAAHILEVTQGVPLAVKIAARLYLDHPDLKVITEDVDSKREIVDQMVRRYLLHTRTNQEDRALLYGLALLRRANQPTAIAEALNLSSQTSYEGELSRLHRRYGFIFTKSEQLSLHPEVRHFLRLWLLEHRSDPGIVTINQRLKEVHWTALRKLEDQRSYDSLQERLKDDQWTGIYLDLCEQQFWLDPVNGVEYILPFMLAASIYRRDANLENFNQAIALDEKNDVSWYRRARVYLITNQTTFFESDIQVAIEKVQNFLNDTPDNWNARFRLASYMLISGNPDAEAQYDQCVSSCSSLTALKNAIRNLDDILTIQPSNEVAHHIRVQLQDCLSKLKGLTIEHASPDDA